jgi:hypothetical protein
MAKVVLGMTMSLDGFINDRNGKVEALYPDLATLPETGPLKEAIQNTGAVVMGRHSFDMAEDPDWFAGNYEFQVPIFVLTQYAARQTAEADRPVEVHVRDRRHRKRYSPGKGYGG